MVLRALSNGNADSPGAPAHLDTEPSDRARAAWNDARVTILHSQPSAPSHSDRLHGRLRPLELALLGIGWLVISAAIAYLFAATPLVDRVLLSGRIAAASPLVRLIVVVCLIIVPVSLGVAGLVRLGGAAQALLARPTAARRATANLDPDVSLIPATRLPDGRPLPELIVGWHGVVVCREIPPDARVRPFSGHWEIDLDGAWMPFENPLEHTVRDAEAVRRHLDSGERDFVVKVYAVVVSSVGMLERVPGCTVVRPEQLASYLATLPRQRSLSSERIHSIARSIVGPSARRS